MIYSKELIRAAISVARFRATENSEYWTKDLGKIKETKFDFEVFEKELIDLLNQGYL